MAAEIRWRLKPGAPLVVAHLSVADGVLAVRVEQGNANFGCYAAAIPA